MYAKLLFSTSRVMYDYVYIAMQMFRFIFPFLFVRNWYSGVWEFSWPRFILFSLTFALFLLGVIIAYVLQLPIMYNAATL